MQKPNENSVSLNKHISSTGICSRREADKLIVAGRVSINGKQAKSGNRVAAGDRVEIDGKSIRENPAPIYLAFNKPVGIVCTTDQKRAGNIVDYIKHPQRLFPVGRLDKPSQGLIFMTNDGDVVNKILRAGNKHEKEYEVTVDLPITSSFLRNMANGVPVLGEITKRCEVRKVSKRKFHIILTQGLNRQIRRMCTHLGFEVTQLNRIRIMHVELGNLPIGDWRELSTKELAQLNKLIKHSSKTQ